MKLKFIRIDVENNTAEAQWFEDVLDADGNIVSSISAKCINYCAEQKDEFLAEVEGADSYIDILGW